MAGERGVQKVRPWQTATFPLPASVQGELASWLEVRDVARLLVVCRQLRGSLAGLDRLWRQLYERERGPPPPPLSQSSPPLPAPLAPKQSWRERCLGAEARVARWRAAQCDVHVDAFDREWGQAAMELAADGDLLLTSTYSGVLRALELPSFRLLASWSLATLRGDKQSTLGRMWLHRRERLVTLQAAFNLLSIWDVRSALETLSDENAPRLELEITVAHHWYDVLDVFLTDDGTEMVVLCSGTQDRYEIARWSVDKGTFLARYAFVPSSSTPARYLAECDGHIVVVHDSRRAEPTWLTAERAWTVDPASSIQTRRPSGAIGCLYGESTPAASWPAGHCRRDWKFPSPSRLLALRQCTNQDRYGSGPAATTMTLGEIARYRNRPLSPAQLQHLLLNTLTVIATLHSREFPPLATALTARYLVLLDRTGTLRLADFGEETHRTAPGFPSCPV